MHLANLANDCMPLGQTFVRVRSQRLPYLQVLHLTFCGLTDIELDMLSPALWRQRNLLSLGFRKNARLTAQGLVRSIVRVTVLALPVPCIKGIRTVLAPHSWLFCPPYLPVELSKKNLASLFATPTATNSNLVRHPSSL